MHNIQRMSSYLLWAFNFLLVAMPLWLVIRWAFIEWKPLRNLIAQGIFMNPVETPEGTVNLANLTLTPLSWSAGFLGDLIGSIPFFLGLVVLRHLFQNYRKGNIFSFENAQKYKCLGWLLLLDGLFLIPLSNMLMVLMATLSNPPGHRCITISFGTPNLEALFWGVLVIVMSWVMTEGYKLQEDQNLTV